MKTSIDQESETSQCSDNTTGKTFKWQNAKLISFGITPTGYISIGIVPMGVVAIWIVPMGVIVNLTKLNAGDAVDFRG